MSRQLYCIHVERSGGWWAISVPDLPGVFSQSRRLDQVVPHATEAIALYLDVAEAEIEVEVEVMPPENTLERLDALRDAAVAAAEASDAVVRRRREAAEALRAEGLPMRDVGELIGLSHQRVSQILAEPAS